MPLPPDDVPRCYPVKIKEVVRMINKIKSIIHYLKSNICVTSGGKSA